MDVSTFPDLDPSFAWIDQRRAIAEVVLRRWTTPEGLIDDFGHDVRQCLRAGVEGSALARLNAVLAAEAEKDERVFFADVSVVFDPATASLRIAARIVPIAGNAFRLTLAIDAVSAAILAVE